MQGLLLKALMIASSSPVLLLPCSIHTTQAFVLPEGTFINQRRRRTPSTTASSTTKQYVSSSATASSSSFHNPSDGQGQELSLGQASNMTATMLKDAMSMEDDEDTSYQSSSSVVANIIMPETTLDNQYELTLPRPLGLIVEEQIVMLQDNNNDDDNHDDAASAAAPPAPGKRRRRRRVVVVTGFNEKASHLARCAVRPGDVVVAVDTSLGGKLWPVSSVDGLTAACTSRFPGKAVTLRLERPATTTSTAATTTTSVNGGGGGSSSSSTATTFNNADNNMAVVRKVQSTVDASSAANQKAKPTLDHQELIKRCRQVLKRYSPSSGSIEQQQTVSQKIAVSAMVADKVLDALASARAPVDAYTLSLLLKAYLKCRQPQDAIKVFEQAVGLRADGRAEPLDEPDANEKGGLVPQEAALSVFTGTALLQAHAQRRNLHDAFRVLACLEGRSGAMIGRHEAAPWPYTGPYGSVTVDTTCYNLALAAAAAAVTEQPKDAVDMALELFTRMDPPSSAVTLHSKKKKTNTAPSSGTPPARDVVTYNTMISILARAGRYEYAAELLEEMKRYKLRADKYTYTSLLQAATGNVDQVQELLYDMQDHNIKADVVTYNALIQSLCQRRQWTAATRIVTDMEGAGVAPNARTYGLLMHALLRADRPDACLSLFASACDNPKTASLVARNGQHLFPTAMAAAAQLQDYQRALELLSQMRAMGIKPEQRALTAAMGACLAAGEYGLAAQVYETIPNPDGTATAAGIAALTGSGQVKAALDALQSPPAKCMTGKQSMRAHETILTKALEQGDWDVARQAWDHVLFRKGAIPGKKLIRSMLHAVGFQPDSRDGVLWATTAIKADIVNGDDADSVNGDASRLEAFRFLLYALDALQRRNLPVDSCFYVALLSLGKQLNGAPRQLVQSLAAMKRTSPTSLPHVLKPASNGSKETVEPARVIDQPPSWLQLLDQCSADPSGHVAAAKGKITMPAAPFVRVDSPDVRRILWLEQDIAGAASSSSSLRAASGAKRFRTRTPTRAT